MAEIALPRQQVTQTSQSAAVGSPLYQRRRQSNTGPVDLMPNPDFSFPMRDPDGTYPAPPLTPNARPMSLQVYPTGRRGSTPGQRQKSASALPDFSFSPAGPAKSPPTATPPHSPMTVLTPTTPSRPIGGHRRGGSEFIGGDGRAGGSTLLSTSPTKGEGVLPPPSTQLRSGPPAGRRGHVHRRSGAVSSHDLSSMMKPSSAPRSGSAPVTPLDGNQFAFGHSVNKSMSQPSLRDTSAFTEDADTMPRPPSRARVGFSDKVEYIRPLSTISSETETSMSTIRGHSATNSLSSVISAGTASPQASRAGRASPSPTVVDDARPSTAGAILDMQKNALFAGEVSNRKRPSSAVSPTAITRPSSPSLPTKRRSFFRLESRRSDPSIHTLSSASDPAFSAPLYSPLPSPMAEDEEAVETADKTKSRKGSRGPRKVKSWASSIIPKKSKHGKKSKDRAAMPPMEGSSQDPDDTDASDDLDFEAIFDVDNTVTIVSPSEVSVRNSIAHPHYTSWQPREFKRVDSDTMSAVIDLDAALGPFNTPQGTIARSGNQRGFAAHRRAMHSAGGVVQNHRRTESAPELVPFEQRITAVATTSTMADVFEEDEPEEHASTRPAEVEQEVVEEPKIQVVESDDKGSGSAINWNFNNEADMKRSDKNPKQDLGKPCSSYPSQQLSSVEESRHATTSDPVEVVEDFEEPRAASLTHSSDSTVTPPMAPVDSKDPPPVMSLSLPMPQQNLMTPDTFTSSFPSPDFRSSQASLDTPRLGTAASSMTDYPVMPSPRFGEPGPELRVSVDDVPSLTSSRSTMTSAMHNAFPMMSPRRPGNRSASLCSAPSDVESRRRKRSSIASLSRLINSSSFGERSKLSNEVRPQSEYLEPTHKDTKKKHKRLSKLMQFWKPKDSSRN